jgi:hypothetical protein
MSYAKIIGFSGNITRPSKTFALVDHVVQDARRVAAQLDILVDAAALQLRSWGSALERVPRDDLSPSIC